MVRFTQFEEHNGRKQDARDDTNVTQGYTLEMSKSLFGNSHMFTVMLHIATLETETFSPKQVIDSSGLVGSVVHPLIHRLTEAGQIEFLGRGPDGRTRLYRVRQTHIWEAIRKYEHNVPDDLTGPIQ